MNIHGSTNHQFKHHNSFPCNHLSMHINAENRGKVINGGEVMKYVTIGRYQFSAVLLLVAAIACPLAFAATYYVWSTRTITFTVDEPLSVTDFPTEIHFHPGQNVTLSITIANSANTDYLVWLDIKLTDTNYQQSYVQTSNQTYTITPGDNTISAWIAVTQDAPNSQQQLTVDFLRL